MKTRVVNIKKEKCDIYIGRGSMWGNPFKIGKDGTREEVIKKYRNMFLNNRRLQSHIGTLRGNKLGCYCAPAPCHGDVLREFADGETG